MLRAGSRRLDDEELTQDTCKAIAQTFDEDAVVLAIRQKQRIGSYNTASMPLRSIRLSSFRDGPLGFLSPISRFCTVDKLVLSTIANTA